ncbi:MAG: hypothetical protein HYY16_06500 [Planctomycetes bacterium]|nr:hypothetical protein [Planctomycetota bacterium]
MGIQRGIVGVVVLGLIGVVAGASVMVAPRRAQEEPPPVVESPQESPQPQDPFKPNPAYVVESLAGELAWLSPGDEEAVRKAGHAPFAGGYQFDVKDAKGNRRCGVVVSGLVLLDRGLVELMGCGDGGKEHESVVRLECDIQSLDHALLLCGLKRGRLPTKIGKPDPEQGSRVVVLVQWVSEGRTVTYRAEDLIISSKRAGTMPRVGFTYVGQWTEMPDPSTAGKKTYRVLAATGTRSLVTTYRDGSALLDTPLEDGLDDTLFAANYMVLPPSGTRACVMLRAPTEEEAEGIADLEKELAK